MYLEKWNNGTMGKEKDPEKNGKIGEKSRRKNAFVE
jgi:hypothetical protein